MPISQFLDTAKKFDLQPYKSPKDTKKLTETHVPFTGTPLRHPFDDDKLVLVADPYSSNTFFYEFRVDDVTFAEELPSMVNMEGVALSMSRLWVKKKSVGMRCTPFVVDDLRNSHRD